MTESGLLAAVAVVMALVGVYVPLLGAAAVLLWPLPILVLIVRHGFKWGVMAVAVAGFLMAALVEPMVALRLVLAFAPGGLALGFAYRADWPPVRTLAAGLAASIAAKLAAFALLFALTGVEPFSMQFEIMEESFEGTVGMYESMGLTEAQIAETRENFTQNLALLRLMLPLIVVFMGLMDTLVNYFAGAAVLRRLGRPVRALPPFVEWRLPPAFLYLFGFSVVGMYWGSTRGLALLYQASLNLFMVAALAGIVEGLAVYWYAARRFRWPRLLAALFLAMVFLNAFLLRIFGLVGLMDMALDYRKRYWGKADGR